MERELRNLRTLITVLAAGAVIVVVVLGFVISKDSDKHNADGPPVMTFVAVSWAAVVVAARFLVVAQVERTGRARIASGDFTATRASRQAPLVEEHGDTGRLFLLYQTRSVLGAAMIEGAALLGGVATFLDGNIVVAGVGLALCASLIAMIPSTDRWEQWRDEQQKLLREETG